MVITYLDGIVNDSCRKMMHIIRSMILGFLTTLLIFSLIVCDFFYKKNTTGCTKCTRAKMFTFAGHKDNFVVVLFSKILVPKEHAFYQISLNSSLFLFKYSIVVHSLYSDIYL